MRAVVGGVERYAMNYFSMPGRMKTAECDACGSRADAFGDHGIGTAVERFRASGWLVENCRPDAMCLCPPCVSMVVAQL